MEFQILKSSKRVTNTKVPLIPVSKSNKMKDGYKIIKAILIIQKNGGLIFVKIFDNVEIMDSSWEDDYQ